MILDRDFQISLLLNKYRVEFTVIFCYNLTSMYAVCLQTSMYIVQPESVYSTGSFHFLRSFFFKKILIDMGYQGVIIQQLSKCFRSQFDLT